MKPEWMGVVMEAGFRSIDFFNLKSMAGTRVVTVFLFQKFIKQAFIIPLAYYWYIKGVTDRN